jgi:ferredoxin
VQVEGGVSSVNWKDIARKSLPPHSMDRNLYLACQAKVLGDVKVTKFDSFWGQRNNLV